MKYSFWFEYGEHGPQKIEVYGLNTAQKIWDTMEAAGFLMRSARP